MMTTPTGQNRRKSGVTFVYTGDKYPNLKGHTFTVKKLAEALGLSKTCLWNRLYCRGMNPESGIDDAFLDLVLEPRKRGCGGNVKGSTKSRRPLESTDPEAREAAVMLKYNSLNIFSGAVDHRAHA